MRKFIKFLIGIGMLALIAGGIILGFAIKSNAFSREDIVTKELVLEEDFDDIYIDVEVSDLTFELATDGVAKVVIKETEKRYNEVTIKDNKLSINTINTHKWYEQIFNFDWERKSITVYLTKDVFNVLNIKDSTGDVTISNKFTFDSSVIECSTGNIKLDAKVNNSVNVTSSTGSINVSNKTLSGDLSIKSSTGDVVLNNITCANLNVDVDTGMVNINDLITTNNFKVKSSTGSIVANNIDGKFMDFKSSTGDISILVLTPKTFNAKTSTGSVNCPNTTGEECNIKTSTGDIVAKVK